MTTNEDDAREDARQTTGMFGPQNHNRPEVGLTAAENLFETATLAQLVEATGPQFWLDAAERERTPPALLRALAESDDLDVVRAVASNDSIDVETRDLLSKHEYGSVRAALIYGPTCTEDFLERFYDDDDYDVVYALCQKSTSTDLLEKLAADEVAPEYEIARNPAISAALLAKLASNDEALVRNAALQNPNVTEEILHAAASDTAANIRESAARHRRVPVKAQRILASDSEVAVRETLAMNRNADAAVLATLTADEHPDVRGAASRRLAERRALAS